MEARDVLERAERAEEAALAQEEYGRRAAVLVSVLAALLAVTSLAGSRAATEAILSQQKASDAYNEYQANSLKRHVNLDDAASLRLLAAGGPRETEAFQQADALEEAVATKYQPAQDELLPKAQVLEHERDVAESRHSMFQFAEAGFQLAIVLCSISIVARAVPLLVASCLLGVMSLLMSVNAWMLLIPLPI